MLTIERLKDMKPYEIFSHGKVQNTPDGAYMTDIKFGDLLHRVACRGQIHDRCIYCHRDEGHTNQRIHDHGEKIRTEEYIKRLVPCDDAAFKMYRY